MNEPETGRKIARLLDRGLDDIKQSTLNRLQSARRASLENYRTGEAIITVGRGASARGGQDWHLTTAKLLSLITLLSALVSVVYWQALHQSDENEEIDIMLLVDDLPINAYLDNEFDAWLDPS
ncbi:MAG: DUF3619 family protein [Pseudomonadota bacterium]|nr:DUF3619 family protein [Pseudomonadota bacterium]